MSSLKKNIGYQTIYQILNTFLPLITAPYLARVLGATQLGIFSYTNSIVSYFTLFAMLGTINYGTRSIAMIKNDKEELSRVFWEIYALQFIATLIFFFLYTMYVICICKENTIIALIQIISLINCFFDINWLYFGIEKFQFIVTRNTIIRLLTVVSILIFVKNPDDLWKYTFIMLFGTFVSQLILWMYLPKNVCFKRVKLKNVFRHLIPNLILFVPLLAMSIYHIMDKTMLGILSTYEETGFYYNSDKVINIPIGILTGISTVMLPRMTSLISEKNEEEFEILFLHSLEYIIVISVAICFGIVAVSNEFVIIFFGKEYYKCILLVNVLSSVLITKSISNSIRNQYLIPKKMEKIFLISVISGSIVNICINYALIPKYGALGAVIGTVIAELLACMVQIKFLSRYIRLSDIKIKTLVYFFIGILMLIVVRFVSTFNISSLLIKVLVEIIIGAITYIVLCLFYWKKTKSFLYVEIFESLKNRLIMYKN